MRKAFLLSIIISMSFRAAAAAVEIDCIAGRLAELAAERTDITELTLRGTIDASDFEFINSSMSSLKVLDLSNTSIKEYSGKVLFSGQTVSDAGIIPSFAFFGSQIESITLPAGATGIGEYAFAGSWIRNIATREKITSFGEGAFKDCSALEKIEIKGKINRLSDYMFDGCAMLVKVILSNEADTVGQRAFAGCRSLRTVPENIIPRSVANEAFAHSGITEVDWTDNRSLTGTGSRVFTRCDSLTKVALPESLAEITPYTFFADAALGEIVMENSRVAVIDTAALAGCRSIEEIKLPESLEYLGDGAMSLTTGLRSIDAVQLNSVPELGSAVWSGIDCKSVGLKVNPTLINEFSTAPQWREFDISTLASIESPAGDSADGISATFDGSRLTVTSPTTISRMIVWSVDGRLLMSAAPGTYSAQAETSRWNGPVFIVGVITGTGHRLTTFKIERK